MPEIISLNISQNLKNHRKQQRLSIQELSEITHVSKTMIGEIERGNANPSISILWKIAEGLKIPLTKLIEMQEPDVTLKRYDEFELINSNEGYDVKTVFPYTDHIEIFYLTLELEAELTNRGHSEGVKEYIYVIEGSLSLTLNDKEYLLEKGDAIKYKATVPHKLLNSGKCSLKIMNILEYCQN